PDPDGIRFAPAAAPARRLHARRPADRHAGAARPRLRLRRLEAAARSGGREAVTTRRREAASPAAKAAAAGAFCGGQTPPPPRPPPGVFPPAPAPALFYKPARGLG